MRMRKKKWAEPELEASPVYIHDPVALRGRWEAAFLAPAPLVLELGCGKGSFAAVYARRNPQTNLLAVDISPDMLGVARRKIADTYGQDKPGNVLLTRYDISHITDILSPEDKVERIFINFCNPWYKPRHYKRRLTHPRQLAQYRELLRAGGEIWFKTDDDELFAHSVGYFFESGFTITRQTDDLATCDDGTNIQTEHETMYTCQGVKIKALVARKTGE